MLSLKAGLELKNLQPQTVLAVLIVNDIFSYLEKDCIVTSFADGKHKVGSLHYVGAAADFRTRHLTTETKKYVAELVKKQLGEDFDVVLESDHLHVEFDPKGN